MASTRHSKGLIMLGALVTSLVAYVACAEQITKALQADQQKNSSNISGDTTLTNITAANNETIHDVPPEIPEYLRVPPGVPDPVPLVGVAANADNTTKAERVKDENVPQAKIAYFIQVSPGLQAHLKRLLSRIHHPDNVYAIHIDVKEDRQSVARFIAEYRQRCGTPCSNVHFMPAETVAYRGITMALNTIHGMEFLLDVDPDWEIFINLSANDYPLVTPLQQRALFGHPEVRKAGNNFLSFFSRSQWKRFEEKRLKRIHLDFAIPFDPMGKMKPTLFVHPLFEKMGFAIPKAEAWMMVTREFCVAVTRGALARRILVNMSYLLSSPEHYFVAVLYNHPILARKIIPAGFRTVFWSYRGRSSGQHPFSVDATLHRKFVFYNTLRTEPGIFARKFNHTNSAMMDKIDAEISGFDVNRAKPDRVLTFQRLTMDRILNLTRSQGNSTTEDWIVP